MSLRSPKRAAPAAAAAADPIAESPPTPPVSDSGWQQQLQEQGPQELVIYEPFLYDLSPTWDVWCFLRAAEVHALARYHDMGDHSAYFSGNLPIRWARIVGVVVAIDEFFGGRRVFTVDDSSGACIECVATRADTASAQPFPRTAATAPQTTTPVAYPDISVGMVIEAKGRIITFRNSRQIRLVSIKPVRCTAHEVVLWGKREKFARETLAAARWVVDEKQIRRRRRKLERHREEVRARMKLKGSVGREDRERRRRRREREYESSNNDEGVKGGRGNTRTGNPSRPR